MRFILLALTLAVSVQSKSGSFLDEAEPPNYMPTWTDLVADTSGTVITIQNFEGPEQIKHFLDFLARQFLVLPKYCNNFELGISNKVFTILRNRTLECLVEVIHESVPTAKRSNFSVSQTVKHACKYPIKPVSCYMQNLFHPIHSCLSNDYKVVQSAMLHLYKVTENAVCSAYLGDKYPPEDEVTERCIKMAYPKIVSCIQNFSRAIFRQLGAKADVRELKHTETCGAYNEMYECMQDAGHICKDGRVYLLVDRAFKAALTRLNCP